MADEFLNEVRQHVYSKYRREDFPDDVTRLVLRHIRATPDLYAKYQVRSLGVADQLHRDIGKMVKEFLGAEVVHKPNGKPDMIPCNPATDLAKSCTRLRPAGNGEHAGVGPVTPRATSAKSQDDPKAEAPPEADSTVPLCQPLSVETPTAFCFPFGQLLQEVRQTDRRPKKVFVLGVYASAVHARWIGPDGRDVVKALAVASEPSIFWRGEGADAIIERIAVPAQAGRLVPADPQFNGPSGVALDELFLKPLGLTRDDAWLCDLVPHSCVNPAQQEALERAYLPLVPTLGLPRPSIPAVPPCLADAARQQAILAELLDSQADTLILLGDQPICWFLSSFVPRWQRLGDFELYGQLHDVVIGGRPLRVLPLAHPRQVAKLGRSSAAWYERHALWTAEHRSIPKPLLG